MKSTNPNFESVPDTMRGKVAGQLGGLLLAAMLSSAALAETPVMNSADNATVSHSKVMELKPGLPVVADSSSTLVRNRHGITFEVDTTGLDPNAVYTLWIVVYNNPEFCVGNEKLMCFPPAGDMGNPDVEASMFWGGGRVTDDYGHLDISHTLYANGEVPGEIQFGPGLLDSQKAVIHVVLRTHGPADTLREAGELDAALNTLMGGCATNTCADVRIVAHRP